MISSKFARFAASTLFASLGFAALGAIEQGVTAASADKVGATSKYAMKAVKLLAGPASEKAKAVIWAERAVALWPNDASTRFLLGRAYLANGRMTAAETSFADALALDPGFGRAALNLALMKASRGLNEDALSLLSQSRDRLDVADYGLALSLAGDIIGGASVLEDAARAPGANARIRQNLALSYALANRWAEARTVASQDLAADLVDARLASWAQLAHPNASWDQVAGVLGIRPVYDPGQPQALALDGSTSVQSAMTEAPHPAPVAPERSAMARAEAAPAPVFDLPSVSSEAAPRQADVEVASVAQATRFGPRSEIVQTLPKRSANAAPLLRAPSSAAKQAVVPNAARTKLAAAKPSVAPATSFRGAGSGRFVVQLGAYANSGTAEAAWYKTSAKIAGLDEHQPVSARVKVKAGSFYRLSVSGFADRDAAGQVCAKVKANGGDCFVRSTAGDTPIMFARRAGGMKIAARR